MSTRNASIQAEASDVRHTGDADAADSEAPGRGIGDEPTAALPGASSQLPPAANAPLAAAEAAAAQACPPCFPAGGPAGRENGVPSFTSPDRLAARFSPPEGRGSVRTVPAVTTRKRVLSMACRISGPVLDCRDPETPARFWCEVLDFAVLGRDAGAAEIGPRDGAGGPQPTVILSPGDDPRNGRLRLHIDVSPTDRDQDAELERLLAAGARFADVGQSGQESWHVLADPEGDEFRLLRNRIAPL